ncbi:MAG: Y-family DNA polymerase [Bacteroidetes bacterium]|nr:Y-family DNA polymerase [Bacteroidota bacterium]
MKNVQTLKSAMPTLFDQPETTGFKAIVDCNSFYCSCERLFRPELIKKPVVVLSNNDGCIVSRSDEAKQLGIGMATPYFMEKHRIEAEGVAVFSSNYNLYGDMSWRVMETLRTLSDTVEVYSVDEAFMDLNNIPEKDLPEYAMHIRRTVEQWTGISVSVGVARTKTLAKVANHIAKKDKQGTKCVTVLATEEDQRIALRKTRVGSIWGVGRQYASKLENMGIISGWDLIQMSEEWGAHHLGGVVGARLIRELKGLPSIGMRAPLDNKKMIATTRMFGDPVSDLKSIREAVATYTSRAAEKLRRQHSAAGYVSVFIVPKNENHNVGFGRGATVSSYMKLPAPTSITHELIKPAVELAERLFKNGTWYKKAGVMLSGLVPDSSIQGNIFVPERKNCGRRLMDMVDNVNFSMRDDVLKFAASGTDRNWKMRQELRSPRYTTRWNELYEIK